MSGPVRDPAAAEPGAARLMLAGAAAIVERDVRLFASYRMRFAAQGVAILFTTTLFYYVSRLVEVEPFDPDAYFGYVVVGLVALELLTATIATMPASLRAELLAGTFERIVVAPLGPRPAIVAMTVFPVLLSLCTGAVTILVAVVLFGLDVEWLTLPLAVPAALLVALAFAPLAVVIGAAVLVFKQAGSAATFAVTGLSLASGAFFPVDLLPGWLAWISEIQPLTPCLDLLRHLILGTDVDGGPWLAVLRLALLAVVLMPLALLVLDAAIGRGRKRGTLTEY